MTDTNESTDRLVAAIESRADLDLDRDDRGRTDLAIRVAYHEVARRFLRNLPAYPAGRYAGRGVVVCGGGERYFPCAWVAIRLLRHLGCQLPIELWHFGPRELTSRQRTLVTALGVEPVDAEDVRQEHPVHHLGGWELKCFALIHSRFREVLLLDADNAPLIDPAALFEWPEYRATGAAFWPDLWRSQAESTAWAAFDVTARAEFEFESGQILLDKAQVWRPLQLAWHYNDHSNYYYRHVYGDKDTFRMAWHHLRVPFAMPARPMEQIECCMCQHDRDGQRIFQHRNMDKYRLDGSNRPLAGYQLEDTCRHFLAELRTLLAGEPTPTAPADGPSGDRPGAGVTTWRPDGTLPIRLDLQQDGRVSAGSGSEVWSWDICPLDGAPHLALLGADAVIGLLRRAGDEWVGPRLDRLGSPPTD